MAYQLSYSGRAAHPSYQPSSAAYSASRRPTASTPGRTRSESHSHSDESGFTSLRSCSWPFAARYSNPPGRSCSPVQTYQGSMHPITISRHLTDALKSLSRREGVTLYMTLVAAFNTLLYRYTGQDDILIGTTSGGRKSSEFQGLLGFFLNTLV